jgi:threonyl-tRNA synthetase
MEPEIDHRRLGRELDLFHLQDEARGSVFWHSRGLAVLHALEEHVRRILKGDGYEEVRSPQVMARSIWEASGHWGKFKGGMMRLAIEGGASALKPVNCPGHIQIVRMRRPSARDLPLRIAEMGIVHRNERKSQLLGLFRLRQFMQDDGHVFCAPEHVASEVARFVLRVKKLYADLGFDGEHQHAALSLRPRVRAGSDELWDRAEHVLADAVARAGLDCIMQPGAGAFYGPKLELVLKDDRGRDWQCGTLQLDFVLPERFGLDYVDDDGKKKPLVMIHRAMLGSFERFVGILLEHHRGRLPPWLAPEAIRVLPVAASHHAYADEVARLLPKASVDARSLPLAKRVFAAHASHVPFVVVVGARDMAQRSIVLREGNAKRELALPDARVELERRVAPPSL